MKDPVLTEDVHWLPCDLAERFMVDVFRGIGVPEDEARICADVLVAADRRGIASHGLSRLKPIYYDRIVHKKIQSATTDFEIVRERGSTAVVDGHHGMGMVIAERSMRMAIEKAREHGTGAVAVRNSTHFGIAAYYSLMAADAGMIGLDLDERASGDCADLRGGEHAGYESAGFRDAVRRTVRFYQ